MDPATALTVTLIGGLFVLNQLASALDRKRQRKPEAGPVPAAKGEANELPEKRVGGGGPEQLRSSPGSEAHQLPEKHLRVIERKLYKDAAGKFVKADGTHRAKPQVLAPVTN